MIKKIMLDFLLASCCSIAAPECEEECEDKDIKTKDDKRCVATATEVP